MKEVAGGDVASFIAAWSEGTRNDLATFFGVSSLNKGYTPK